MAQKLGHAGIVTSTLPSDLSIPDTKHVKTKFKHASKHHYNNNNNINNNNNNNNNKNNNNNNNNYLFFIFLYFILLLLLLLFVLIGAFISIFPNLSIIMKSKNI